MIALLIISLCAICKAFADTLDHHFDLSIFRYMPRKYFDPNVITKTAPQIFGYPLDAWHITNSIQLAGWLALPLIYNAQFTWWIDFSIGTLVFVLVFNFFYNKIFRKKNYVESI